MKHQGLQKQVAAVLATADIKINGPDPWDLQIHDERFYRRLLSQGTLGLGESYMDGWWDCEHIDEFICKALRADLYKKAGFGWKPLAEILLAKVMNLQTKKKAANNIHRTYDTGNKLYQLMLDKHMAYTCGYWKNAATLEQAQENKMYLICRKVGLQP